MSDLCGNENCENSYQDMQAELTETEGAVADLMEKYDELEAKNQRLMDVIKAEKIRHDLVEEDNCTCDLCKALEGEGE